MYVANYYDEIVGKDLRTLENHNFILCIFDDADKAQSYAEEYYKNDCSKNASIKVVRNKKGGLSIKVKDEVAFPENQTIETRVLSVNSVMLNSGNAALDDIQDVFFDENKNRGFN